MNNTKPYPRIYYEFRLQQKLRKLVEQMEAINARHGGKALCLECYQKKCICSVQLESDSKNWVVNEIKNSVHINGSDEIDSTEYNGYRSNDKENNKNGVYKVNGNCGSHRKLNGDHGDDIQVYGEDIKVNGGCRDDHKMNGDQRSDIKMNGGCRNDYNLNCDHGSDIKMNNENIMLNYDCRDKLNVNSYLEEDDPITFYSKLIVPPASLLLRYIMAERCNEGKPRPATQELMKRCEIIRNLNVHAWLKLLDGIDDDNHLSDSISVNSLDDDNDIVIRKPIGRPTTATANTKELKNEEAPTTNGSITQYSVKSIPSSTATVLKSSGEKVAKECYSLFIRP